MDTGVFLRSLTAFRMNEDALYSAELQCLREQLQSARASAIRQRWRVFAGFALARHLRYKLMNIPVRPKASEPDSIDAGMRVYREFQTRNSVFSTNSSAAGGHTREMQALRRQLAEQEELTATVRQAATKEIERLQALLAKESGDHAASVCEMESQYEQTIRQLRTDLSHSQQAVAVLSKRYAELKRTCKKLNFQLTDLRARENESLMMMIQVTDKYVFLNGHKQMVLDRLHELETKLAWASSSSSSPNEENADADKFFAIQSRASGLDLRTRQVEDRLTVLENKLEVTVHLLEKAFALLNESNQAAPDFSRPLKPTVVSMGPDGTGIEENTSGCTDRSTSSNCCTAVEVELSHLTQPVCDTDEAIHLEQPDSSVSAMADSNPSESSSEISSSDSRHDGPKTLFTGPHAPRFCRYEYTAFEREPVPLLNPVVPCRPVLHTFSGASEWVSSSEVVSDSSFVKMDEKMSQQILGRLQGMKYDSENKAHTLPPATRIMDEPVIEAVATLSYPTQHFASRCTIAHESSNGLVAHQPRLSKLGQVFKSIRRGRTEVERYPNELTNHDRASR
ncbi:hypothetical protein CSKR_103577 [Clonorchis sinensis]|uniref:Uncharacterized protein n=2 Tax=Clonorchis sinensis TaxID=79923 RepID=A0A3R7EUJ0_CLOSI|nr:hypothetical protein CSKR_103577 [Clonorchis sinensis]